MRRETLTNLKSTHSGQVPSMFNFGAFTHRDVLGRPVSISIVFTGINAYDLPKRKRSAGGVSLACRV